VTAIAATIFPFVKEVSISGRPSTLNRWRVSAIPGGGIIYRHSSHTGYPLAIRFYFFIVMPDLEGLGRFGSLSLPRVIVGAGALPGTCSGNGATSEVGMRRRHGLRRAAARDNQ